MPTKELALQYAAQADADFTAGIYKSYIQGIPFAIKDTYDLAGHATAYGSWEYLDNIVETESPLVTYALQAGAVPLFKSSVPQLTWGFANFNGTTYSCLNGGYSAGAGSSGGSSIGSGAAVCLGVVPVSICEQTGSSCQAPAIANGIATMIPSLGTFSRENNGLYSMESDRPGLLCRDVMSCAVFYNYSIALRLESQDWQSIGSPPPTANATHCYSHLRAPHIGQCAASPRVTRSLATCPSRTRRPSTSRPSPSASWTTRRPPAGRKPGTRRSRASAATSRTRSSRPAPRSSRRRT